MIRWRDPILSAAFAFSAAMVVIEVWAGFAFASSSLHASALDFLADAAFYATSLSGVGLSARARARADLCAWAISLLAGIAVLASAVYHYVEIVTPHGRAMAIIGLLAFVANVVVGMGLRRSRVPEAAHHCDTAEIGNLITVVAAALVCTTGSRWPDLAIGWVVGGLAVTSAWQGMRRARNEIRAALISGAGIVLHAASVEAHAIAGNRLFAGTLTFDDPAALDEMDLPFISSERVPQPLGGTGRDTTVNASITRLLWPGFAISADSNWTVQDRVSGTTTGFGPTHLSLKGQFFEDDLHETLVSGSLSWGIAGLGNPTILDTPDHVITPNLLFGRGFGDFPGQLSWLRPFGITGSLSADIPTASTSRLTRTAPVLGNPTIIHTAFSVQFSTLYLTDQFVPGELPPQEPLNQWVPLVEFQFDTPFGGGYGRKTAGTINPGVAYVFDKYQLSLEGIVPVNRAGGTGFGVRVGVILFIDDLIPSLFGKPVFH